MRLMNNKLFDPINTQFKKKRKRKNLIAAALCFNQAPNDS